MPTGSERERVVRAAMIHAIPALSHQRHLHQPSRPKPLASNLSRCYVFLLTRTWGGEVLSVPWAQASSCRREGSRVSAQAREH